ncbi:MAG: hypothetical protein NTX52_12600, partial [Planctomycetota bacterium]|nr:hypothetical protein [Planctomycetota bacterium]
MGRRKGNCHRRPRGQQTPPLRLSKALGLSGDLGILSRHKISYVFVPAIVYFALTLAVVTAAQTPEDASKWTIYITNDNCPDYTWGLTEKQTRQSFSDIVRAHLDEMSRTDNQEPANRDCYNMAVTQEALCFVEHYPDRKDELIGRIKEGRVFVSPYLCNSLWALQRVEGAIRTFYPARRLEKEWGISIDVAEHIEQPCLPWGVASILAGCGIRWISIPYYGYDSTFSGLKNPPLFILEGPDGSKVRVILDRWVSSKSSYTQGAHILGKPETIVKEWLPHYSGLGQVYPLQVILASGTHGDISPGSGSQARNFAEAIIRYNAQPGEHPKLVNATLPQFCRAVDEVQAKTPFLPTLRGCFGHSWDLWPVSLAKYVADMREGDRDNKRHNAELRQKWSQELNRLGHKLLQLGWSGIGLESSEQDVSIFNSLSFLRKGLVCVQSPENINTVVAEGKNLNCQLVTENGRRILYFVSPQIPGFGFKRLQLKSEPKADIKQDKLAAT